MKITLTDARADEILQLFEEQEELRNDEHILRQEDKKHLLYFTTLWLEMSKLDF